MQRGPLERETRFIQIIIQCPGSWIYIPHPLVHAVLTSDTGSPTIVSTWDAATTTSQQILFQTLD